MQRILNALLQFRNPIIYFFLLALSVYFSVNQSPFHQYSFQKYGFYLSSKLYYIKDALGSYYDLKVINQQLLKENEQLKEIELSLGDLSLYPIDFMQPKRFPFKVKRANVIKNSYKNQRNFLILNIGSDNGIQPEMGVISKNGIIGVVHSVSKNYSSVISILNKDLKMLVKEHDYHGIYVKLLNFCTLDLSAFYFDIRKDTLYCDPKVSEKRKSTLLLLNIILDSLLKWFAPILSFTTEEIYQLVSKSKKSIHLEKFTDFPKKFENINLYEKWSKLIKIRDACNLSIEEKRANKEIGSSLEASLEIRVNKNLLQISKDIDFAELCITSHAKILEHKEEEVKVNTSKAKGNKCPICWKIKEGKCTRNSCPNI